jgi:hypothetical protein
MAIALTNPSATKQLLISIASSLVSVQVENSGLPARMLHEPGSFMFVARAGLPVHVMAHRQTMLQCGRDWFLRNNTLQNIETCAPVRSFASNLPWTTQAPNPIKC